MKDKAVLYGAGSSDPRVRFKVTGTKDLHCTSKCIKKSLDPSWRETFSLPLTKDYSEDEKPIDFGINGPILEVTCEDVDTVSSADFMGELNLPVFVRRPFFAFSFFRRDVVLQSVTRFKPSYAIAAAALCRRSTPLARVRGSSYAVDAVTSALPPRVPRRRRRGATRSPRDAIDASSRRRRDPKMLFPRRSTPSRSSE